MDVLTIIKCYTFVVVLIVEYFLFIKIDNQNVDLADIIHYLKSSRT